MRKRILSSILAGAMVFSIPMSVPAAAGSVTKLELDPPKYMQVELNDFDSIDAEVKVKGGASTAVTAVSSDPSLIQIDELETDEDEPGLTTIYFDAFDKLGTATITVTTVDKGENGKPLSATVTIEVVEALPDEPEDEELDFEEAELDPREDGEHDELDGSKTTIVTKDGDQTKTNVKETAEGTIETVTVVKANGDYTKTVTTKDSFGNLIETKMYSVESGGGVIIMKSEVVRQDNSSSSAAITVDAATGEIQEYTTKTDNGEGGWASREYWIRNMSGITATNGLVPSAASDEPMAIYKGGEASDGLINIPSMITLFSNGESLPVTGISAGAIKGSKVFVGENVATIETGAFENSGTTSLTFRGAVSKKMFAKNALKGAGGKGGKDLTITVNDKKSKKTMKKAAKKAGVKRAKVTYRLR